jgi:hypothetical protein
MSQHTPGPWFPVRNEHYWEIRTGSEYLSGDQIGDACSSLFYNNGQHAEGNAKLMAAAPDLLDFAKQVVKFAADHSNFYLMAWAQDVVNKVEGKP